VKICRFVYEGGLNGFEDGDAGFDFAEMIEHHGGGPDLFSLVSRGGALARGSDN